MISLLLTKKIISLYIIVLSGAILVRSKLLKSTDSKVISLLACISPVASSVVQFAQVYSTKDQAEYASAINVATTMLCVITMPIMVFLFQL